AARLRGILRTLGRGELNAGSLALYERMSELYPDEVIRIAAEECSRTGGGTDELMDLLSAWKKKGLESTEEIKSYVSAFHQRNALLKAIRNVWGGEAPLLSEANRKYADRWETEMGFSREMILLAAESASDARNPM
ncbi:hypothetical protein RCJ22_02450, partial [Vibrio sp. FNV 38]|nr:hypothetical protein [Vibrio sp. FNV 38]